MNSTHWISIAQVIATAFVGVIAGFITWKMQSKQIDIANGVKEIARGQHETAATKLRLELFEKRFKAYQEVVACLDEAMLFDGKMDNTYLEDTRAKYVKACAPMRFLFNLSVYNLLSIDITKIMDNYSSAMQTMQEYADTDEEQPSLRTLHLNINEMYEAYATLNKAVEPLLIIEKEKSLIA